MRKTLFNILFKSCLVFSLLLAINDVAVSQKIIIAGIVKHGNEVLEAASVSLGNSTVLSDKNGRFSFSAKRGSYVLTISHAGYKKIEQKIAVDSVSKRTFEFDMEPIEQLGEVVVLGSRSNIQRSNLNTAVPVDAFSSKQLMQTGRPRLMQMLNFMEPSLNASPLFATESVTLRGLSPDQTLILVNGIRYNNVAYLNPGVPGGQLGKGSVANDLNTIPFSSIARVEILRDGATALYGSDAVAGVINIVLKESGSSTSVNIDAGQYYKGDGTNLDLALFHGMDLNKKGFLNFSGDFRLRNPAFRGGKYTGPVYSVDPGQDDSITKARNFDRNNVGNAGITKSISSGVLVNGVYHLTEKTTLSWTGAVNHLSVNFVDPYFLPLDTIVINTLVFPDGFKPTVKPGIWNIAGMVGMRGLIGHDISWEYGSAFGMNSIHFLTRNTNNPSQEYTLGRNAPTTFYTGTMTYDQLTNTIHFIRNLDAEKIKLKTMSLNWGAELRLENFRMKAGEEASWKNYDSLLRKPGSAQGSQTVSPENVLNKRRTITGVYASIESDLNDHFLVSLASRYEYYDDFGGNLAGKLAARYKISDKITFRSSIGNGFRAPSLQQRFWSIVFPGAPINIAGTLTPTTIGIFNNDHNVSKLFGVPPLTAEHSFNVEGGLTSTISSHIFLTIDAYWIQVKNRVVISGFFDRSNPEVDSLLKDYPYIDQAAFFSNAINMRTHGIDIVLSGRWSIRKGQFDVILASNVTNTHPFGEVRTAANLSASLENKNTLFTDEARTNLEKGQPRSKIILTLNYQKQKLAVMLRNTRFGETAFQYTYFGQSLPPESFSAKILTDVSVSYSAKSWLTITSGADNVFNVYPDRIRNYENTDQGTNLYATDGSQFGYYGGYYFVGLSFNF